MKKYLNLKNMRGQVMTGIGVVLGVLVLIIFVIFFFSQLRREGEPSVPLALSQAITIAQEEEEASLEEQLGIEIGDLDIVHLSFGSFYTLTYSRNGDFVVIVDDSSREAEARNAVTAWFASKGVNDLSKLNIIWNIKPPCCLY